MAGVRSATPAVEGNGLQKRPFSARWLRRRLVLIMMFFSTTLLLFWHFGAFGLGRPQQQKPSKHPLVVTLPGYGSFRGTKVLANVKNTKKLSNTVDVWLGVEYSTQPVGKNRFKPVTWPEAFEGTKDATSLGPACYQNIYGSLGQSEACLTVSIYRPSGIPIAKKLPVLVFLHGGSFVIGSHRSFDGTLFVAKSAQPLMVITVQYRLGALGSLPGKFMEEEGLLNLGIRDQKMALGFLQEYVEYFGGNPKKITLGGQSAGGHSVGIHLFHNYGQDAGKPLFHQAILASGSPTARAFPGVNYPLYERQVRHLMDYFNCPTSPSSTALECLQSVLVEDIQFISTSLYNANNHNITWPWQPVSPGPLFEKRGSTSGEDGTFFKIPILISSTTDEGKAFTPHDLQTNKDYLGFWKTLVPDLTPQDLADLDRLYPDPQTGQSPYKPKAQTFISPQYERVSAAYGDYSYICPVQDTASRLSSANAPVYKARFNTPNFAPTYMGVPHASDTSYFNGRATAQYPAISDLYSAYWASFIVSGDPNTFKEEGTAKWDKYEVGKMNGRRELVVSPPHKGGVHMEMEDQGIRTLQCAWWRDQDRAKRLNK
ncbi:alpha/beta-hydrolase [Cucurbitaria berberidis CBS 394.84]|uniref:Carboxylic ester hydrolase n=1 Tax=Cucurbitaria berberidis CBS 394.84 TaxID=1168544 RepID=A0A9P4GLP8_9PLEO|nr:alpha/beta-hydrolase [Cucurbitaria berberidis CBS 394.84]KAF1847636.1 alpha/beta-hydrolase [Cucurbitaria berberidis CBS 394.84]